MTHLLLTNSANPSVFQEKGLDKLKLKPLKSLKSSLKMLTTEVKTLINKWVFY